jgi:hypothetical protein
MANDRGRQLLIMMGCPRSGTTWLQAMVGAHADVCTAGELKIFELFTRTWEDSWNTLIGAVREDRGIRRFLQWEDLRAHMISLAETVFERMEEELGRRPVLLDKTPQYVNGVIHIADLFPESRFIHVIRDGRDVAASLVAASDGWGADWAPKTLPRAARYWREHVVAGLEGRALGDRYMELRYEDALSDPSWALRACWDFAGLEYDGRLVDEVTGEFAFEKMREHRQVVPGHRMPKEFFRRGRSGGWEHDLSPSDRLQFDRLAGDLLVELGYAEPGWWAVRPGDGVMLPLLSRFRRITVAAKKLVKTLIP